MNQFFTRIPILIPLGIVAALAVFAYNTWSFCGGRCSVSTFFNPGPVGLLLLGANFFAVLILLLMRSRHRRAVLRQQCRCGVPLQNGWLFCPECGKPAG